jgi:hypothetical protein
MTYRLEVGESKPDIEVALRGLPRVGVARRCRRSAPGTVTKAHHRKGAGAADSTTLMR